MSCLLRAIHLLFLFISTKNTCPPRIFNQHNNILYVPFNLKKKNSFYSHKQYLHTAVFQVTTVLQLNLVKSTNQIDLFDQKNSNLRGVHRQNIDEARNIYVFLFLFNAVDAWLLLVYCLCASGQRSRLKQIFD